MSGEGGDNDDADEHYEEPGENLADDAHLKMTDAAVIAASATVAQARYLV